MAVSGHVLSPFESLVSPPRGVALVLVQQELQPSESLKSLKYRKNFLESDRREPGSPLVRDLSVF